MRDVEPLDEIIGATVDHGDEGLSEPNFKICGWRTNDCKSDLAHAEFAEVCRQVIAHFENNPNVLLVGDQLGNVNLSQSAAEQLTETLHSQISKHSSR